MKRNKTLESDAINRSNKVRHPAHDDEQQQQAAALQLQQQQDSNTQSGSRSLHDRHMQIRTRVIRGTAAYSIIITYQVQVPFRETTHGV